LKTDSNSLYNLAFNLREDAEIIHALILNQNTSPVSFSSGDIDENTGLPKQTGEGTRYLYTGNSGLVRLFLGRDLGLGSYFGGVDLGVSNSDGRIVVVSESREVMQNFDSHVKQLQIERDKQVAEIDSRYQQALEILKGSSNL
ncbi:hypothetical protein HZA33_00435, partial [Candidatus Pacearchaeota archaeon]|nr:hypothetical protein [Candidatus Pacearchaeota archaeon]